MKYVDFVVTNIYHLTELILLDCIYYVTLVGQNLYPT